MSWAQQRLKLKQTPIDSWSLKEQLTLALAVLRTGDQNWVSVSRTMKQFNEPGRPLDWYSQKNCALQYNLIMENRDIPKRKRGDKIDAKDDPGETIVRMLSQKRMDQLRNTIDKEKDEIRKLEKQVELLSSDNVSEQELDRILQEIQREEEEDEARREAHTKFIKDREDKKLAIQAALKTGYFARGSGSTSEVQVTSSEAQQQQPRQQTTNINTTKPDNVIQTQSAAVADKTVAVGAVTSPAKTARTFELSKDGDESSTTSSVVVVKSESNSSKDETGTNKKQKEEVEGMAGKEDVVEILKERISGQETTIHNTDKTSDKNKQQLQIIEVRDEPETDSKDTTTASTLGSTVAKTTEPDVVDLEPPTESGEGESDKFAGVSSSASSAATTSAMDVDGADASNNNKNKMVQEDDQDQDDDEMQVDDAEEINAGGSFMEDGVEAAEVKTEVKEEVSQEMKEEEKTEAQEKEQVKVEVLQETNIKQEVITEQDTKPKIDTTTASVTAEAATEAAMEVDEPAAASAAPVKEVEVKLEKETVEKFTSDNKTSTPEEASQEAVEKSAETSSTTTTSTTSTSTAASSAVTTATTTESAPVTVSVPEPEAEVKRTPSTAKTSARTRGRPRSKKNSEVVPEAADDQQPSSGQQTGAQSSPSSTRPTSPSPESPSVSEPPSTPKLLEATSSRLKARRSSRQGLARALKEAGGGGGGAGGAATTSAPVSPLSTEDEKEYKSWKKGMLLVWNQIAAHKHANIFAGPVSETDAPDYKTVVFEPMDLGAIKKNIESGIIRTTDEFQRDLSLMFFNATMYNSTDHPVHTLTLAMQKDTEKMIKEFLNTQALMKATEAPKLRTKEAVKVLTSRTRTGSGSQGILEDKKKS